MYNHCPIRLRGVVLDLLSTGTAVPIPYKSVYNLKRMMISVRSYLIIMDTWVDGTTTNTNNSRLMGYWIFINLKQLTCQYVSHFWSSIRNSERIEDLTEGRTIEEGILSPENENVIEHLRMASNCVKRIGSAHWAITFSVVKHTEWSLDSAVSTATGY